MAQTDCTRTVWVSLVAVIATVLLAAGCDEQAAAPPITLDEYRLQANRRGAYPDVVVAQHNLHRIIDDGLAMDERRRSLELLAHLKDSAPEAMTALIDLFNDPDTSPALRNELMDVLLANNDPSMTSLVVSTLQQPDAHGPASDAMLTWLSRNADAGALAEIVKLWAAEPVGGPNEAHYRDVVEKMRRQRWDRALLGALNAKRFMARGSAIEILSGRRRPSELKQDFAGLRPHSEAVAAIQTFINGFDYVPTSRAALMQTVVVYKTQQRTMPQAAALAGRWASDPHPYLFDIRHYPLLTVLAPQARAHQLTRDEIVVALARAQLERRHPVYRAGGPAAARMSTRLGVQSDRVSMADLWILRLLDQMLTRRQIQRAMRVLADRDRRDTSAAMGGLIVYENDQAEAKLYRADRHAGTDLRYVPAKSLTGPSRKALCRFVAHFERLGNADRVGPTLEELAEARATNMSGLVVTSLDDRTFCAHYYTPSGLVISIGQFPFAP